MHFQIRKEGRGKGRVRGGKTSSVVVMECMLWKLIAGVVVSETMADTALTAQLVSGEGELCQSSEAAQLWGKRP